MTKKISFKKSADLIEQYHLQSSFARDLSLLGYSTVVLSYKSNLTNMVGFNYKAFAVLRNDKTCLSMADPIALESQVVNLLKDAVRTKATMKRAFPIYQKYSKQIENIFKNTAGSGTERLANLLDAYLHYSASLGSYNIVYRAISDNSFSSRGIAPDLITKFANERNIVGGLFPRVENFLKGLAPVVEMELKLKSGTVLNLTYAECLDFLKNRRVFVGTEQEVKSRSEAWFFVSIFDDDEYVCSGSDEVGKIYKKFIGVDTKNTSEIRGFSAYPGKTSGKVRILPLLNLPNDFRFEQGDILISVHTNPALMPFIRKSSAIITDEGGILSHAAIISRELKIPCIIGTKIATKVLKDGDFVEVDADKGIVKIIKRAES